MADIEERITAALYRKFCPPSLDLGNYHLGMLPGEQAIAITQHLAECLHCRREIQLLEGYLQDVAPDVERSLADRVVVWIASLLPEPGSAGLTPAFAFRGDPERTMLYQAGDAQLTLEVQDDPGTPGQRSLLGLVLGVDPAGLKAQLWEIGPEELVAESSPLRVVEVDDLGNFVLSGLPPGVYRLVLSGSRFEIQLPRLEVR